MMMTKDGEPLARLTLLGNTLVRGVPACEEACVLDGYLAVVPVLHHRRCVVVGPSIHFSIQIINNDAYGITFHLDVQARTA